MGEIYILPALQRGLFDDAQAVHEHSARLAAALPPTDDPFSLFSARPGAIIPCALGVMVAMMLNFSDMLQCLRRWPHKHHASSGWLRPVFCPPGCSSRCLLQKLVSPFSLAAAPQPHQPSQALSAHQQPHWQSPADAWNSSHAQPGNGPSIKQEDSAAIGNRGAPPGNHSASAPLRDSPHQQQHEWQPPPQPLWQPPQKEQQQQPTRSGQHGAQPGAADWQPLAALAMKRPPAASGAPWKQDSSQPWAPHPPPERWPLAASSGPAAGRHPEQWQPKPRGAACGTVAAAYPPLPSSLLPPRSSQPQSQFSQPQPPSSQPLPRSSQPQKEKKQPQPHFSEPQPQLYVSPQQQQQQQQQQQLVSQAPGKTQQQSAQDPGAAADIAAGHGCLHGPAPAVAPALPAPAAPSACGATAEAAAAAAAAAEGRAAAAAAATAGCSDAECAGPARS